MTRSNAEANVKSTALGTVDGELDDDFFLASQRVRIANQGHAPIAAATQAVHATLKALREGVRLKDLPG